MKRLLNTLLVCVLCSSVAFACPPSGDGAKASTKVEKSMDAAVQFASLDLDVKGMTCAGCENKVKASLASIDGVVETKKVCSKSDKASLTFDPNVTSSDEIIKQLAKATGYSVAVVKSAGISDSAARKCSAECAKACCSGKSAKGKSSCTKAKAVGDDSLEKE